MRALVITSMYPSAEAPGRGSFVRDQVEALARIPGVDVELFAFSPGGVSPYVAAARALRHRYRSTRFDVVHAHFGLTAWPAFAVGGAPHVVTLHGTDLVHPRSRAITSAALCFVDLIAPVSAALAQLLPAHARRRRVELLPCGVDVRRFTPTPRRDARAALGLDQDGRFLLFPADPARPEKRYDRAREVAGEIPLLALRNVDPSEVPLWVNAADAVLVPSARESFGLAVLEALACDVPVLATPVGIAQDALAGIPGTLCSPFEAAAWRAALNRLLAQDDPRVPGRAAAERYSAERTALDVFRAWQALT
jgi:glycosyltransferase involved in cell wall biosynthesis